jgi:hypothetical protein
MLEENGPEVRPEQTDQKTESVTLNSSVPAFGQAGNTRLAIPAKLAHHHRLFKEWFAELSKLQKVLFMVAVTVITVAIVGGIIYAVRPKTAPVTSGQKLNVQNKLAAAPNTVPSTLTGLQVDKSVNERPVTGVMIENSIEARPQSGLDQAGVVFEAEAEGGITRFLALFQDSQPSYIGPVRSARPYYIQWCQGFDCAYAHVGGSPDALQDIKAWGIKDLNQFYGGSYFHRISSRAAPHNVYTSIEDLNKFEASKGYITPSFTGFERLVKEGKADPAAPVAHSINLDYLGARYDVHYDYDAGSNSYKRSEGGAPHNAVDANGTTTQLSPKVIVAMAVTKTRGALDASNAYYSNYQVVGSGAVKIFQNGTVVEGTWSKPSPTSQITFTDASGKAVELNPGQTWISVLGSSASANYN